MKLCNNLSMNQQELLGMMNAYGVVVGENKRGKKWKFWFVNPKLRRVHINTHTFNACLYREQIIQIADNFCEGCFELSKMDVKLFCHAFHKPIAQLNGMEHLLQKYSDSSFKEIKRVIKIEKL